METDCDLASMLTTEHLKVAMRWLDLISFENKWDLTQFEKLKLLGGISDIEYNSLLTVDESSSLNKLSIPVIERLVLLIKIASSIAALVGSEQCFVAFKNKNSHPIFNSLSIKNFLLDSRSVESYYAVLMYLEDTMYQ